jgi:hypothetical protein
MAKLGRKAKFPEIYEEAKQEKSVFYAATKKEAGVYRTAIKALGFYCCVEATNKGRFRVLKLKVAHE